jgi:hypothetical protein
MAALTGRSKVRAGSDPAHSRKLRNLIFVLLTCLAAWGGAAYAAWVIFA